MPACRSRCLDLEPFSRLVQRPRSQPALLRPRELPPTSRSLPAGRCRVKPVPCGAVCMWFSPPLWKASSSPLFIESSICKELLSKTIAFSFCLVFFLFSSKVHFPSRHRAAPRCHGHVALGWVKMPRPSHRQQHPPSLPPSLLGLRKRRANGRSEAEIRVMDMILFLLGGALIPSH